MPQSETDGLRFSVRSTVFLIDFGHQLAFRDFQSLNGHLMLHPSLSLHLIVYPIAVADVEVTTTAATMITSP